ncbi:MAG: hypothetical protein JXB42_09470 [Deltaproteobacteria bacterium]|nr:hypothetical protein [Deltaproteobacteria bacterium]
MINNKDYFLKTIDQYRDASEYTGELYQNIGKYLNNRLCGRVIDFGNGGVINYQTDNLNKVYCIDIINKNRSEGKIEYLYGDFYDINPNIEADCLILQFLLHHLTDDSRLEYALKNATTLLTDPGKLFVMEVIVPAWIERLQNLFRPVIFSSLALLKRPSLRFFGIVSLRQLIMDAGFQILSEAYVSIRPLDGKKMSPAPVLFPALKIPGKLYPFKCVIIEARKQQTLS